MRRAAFRIVIGAVLGACAVSAILIGGWHRSAAADVIVVEQPPPDRTCYCSDIWEPVVCRGSDGSHHAFSNGCFAACAGYTDCARVVTP